jgi:hypothetical protein
VLNRHVLHLPVRFPVAAAVVLHLDDDASQLAVREVQHVLDNGCVMPVTADSRQSTAGVAAMGLRSLRPKKKRPVLSPSAAMTTLDQLRERLRATVEQAVRDDLSGMFGLAEVCGWDHLLEGMTADQRHNLVKKWQPR